MSLFGARHVVRTARSSMHLRELLWPFPKFGMLVRVNKWLATIDPAEPICPTMHNPHNLKPWLGKYPGWAAIWPSLIIDLSCRRAGNKQWRGARVGRKPLYFNLATPSHKPDWVRFAKRHQKLNPKGRRTR